MFLIKPSLRELREYAGRELLTEAEQLVAARELIDAKITGVVVVSLGADGALLVTADGAQRFRSMPVRAGSGVGAGDAMVAAITVGLSRGWSLENSVRYGIAAGSAMLMTPGTATPKRADVDRFFKLVNDPVAAEAPARQPAAGTR